jgi:hypothetical protein
MGNIFLYISANFLPFFSGLTTQYAPRLNQCISVAKKHDSGWVLAWIFLDSGSNIFRLRIICMLFSFQFSWIFDRGGEAIFRGQQHMPQMLL